MPPIRSGVSGDVVTAVSTVVEEEESRCRQVSCLSDTDHLANCGSGRRVVVVVALLAQLCEAGDVLLTYRVGTDSPATPQSEVGVANTVCVVGEAGAAAMCQHSSRVVTADRMGPLRSRQQRPLAAQQRHGAQPHQKTSFP